MTAGTDPTDESPKTPPASAAEPPAPSEKSPQGAPPAASRRLLQILSRPGAAALVLLALGALLLLPRIAAFGLWDPHEVRLVEGAEEPITVQQLWRPEHAFKPRLPMVPLKLGTQLLGSTELGARLPMAGLGMLALLSLFYLGVQLGRVRAATLGGLALLTMPVLFLSSRQASLTLLPLVSQIIAVAGLLGLCWPRPGRHLLDVVLGAVIAAIGLGLGLLSTGALVGVATPAAAVALSLALVDGPLLGELFASALFGAALIMPVRDVARLVQPERKQLLGVAVGLIAIGAVAAVVDAIQQRGRPRRGLWIAAIVLGLGLCSALPTGGPGYSPWLAGLVRWPMNREIQIDSLIKSIGFFAFPWSALLPLAFAALLGRSTEDTEGKADPGVGGGAADRRAGLAQVLPLAWFGSGYVLATLHAGAVGDTGLVAVGALALALGLYLEALLLGRAGGVLAGLFGGFLLCAIGRDFFFQPEQYLSAQLTETLRWPGPLLNVAQVLSSAGLILAAAFGAIIGLSPTKGLNPTETSRSLADSPSRARLRSLLVPVAIGLPLLTALLTVHVLVPQVTRHVSYRGLFTRFKQLGGGQLAVFGTPQGGAGSKVYGQKSQQVHSMNELFDFLHKPGPQGERSFAIVGASELASVDQFSFQTQRPYVVIDDSNSQILLLAAQVRSGEEDRNPLRRLISNTRPQPKTAVSATFEDNIELIGYDLPAEISRGEDIPLRLYFRVIRPPGGGYKVFVHFDGMGARFNGDHVPLDGKYSTPYWTAGQYIIDEHRVPTSRLNQAPGYYQVFTGFWPGGDGARLKVSSGAHEPDQRVRLGTIRIK